MSTSASTLTLPRNRLFKHGRDFLRLKTNGRRIALGCLVVNWMPLAGEGQGRLGLIASRSVGGAVQRNRARRLMREVYRLHQYDFKEPTDVVLVARPSIAGKSFASVERDFLSALNQARLRKVKA